MAWEMIHFHTGRFKKSLLFFIALSLPFLIPVNCQISENDTCYKAHRGIFTLKDQVGNSGNEPDQSSHKIYYEAFLSVSVHCLSLKNDLLKPKKLVFHP